MKSIIYRTNHFKLVHIWLMDLTHNDHIEDNVDWDRLIMSKPAISAMTCPGRWVAGEIL